MGISTFNVSCTQGFCPTTFDVNKFPETIRCETTCLRYINQRRCIIQQTSGHLWPIVATQNTTQTSEALNVYTTKVTNYHMTRLIVSGKRKLWTFTTLAYFVPNTIFYHQYLNVGKEPCHKETEENLIFCNQLLTLCMIEKNII